MVMDNEPEHDDDRFDAIIAQEKAGTRAKRTSSAVSVAPAVRTAQFSDAVMNKFGSMATRKISKFHVLDWPVKA
jgi:hypothetical protein